MAASSRTLATRSIVSPFIAHPRQVELHEASVFLEQLPVSVEFAAIAQVADEVGVHARLVLAAGLLVRATYGEVDRPAELLVEEDVRARPTDSVVGPDPEFPEVPCPRVGVEQAHQVLLAPLRARLDDPAFLEAEPGPGDLTSSYRRGNAEVDRPVGRVLDRTGKNLAARHVAPACGVDERARLDGERQVRLGPDDTGLARRLEPLFEPDLLGGLLAPVPHGVFLVQAHRLEDELFVLGESHAGLLRQRLRREKRHHPAVFLQHQLAQRFVPPLKRLLLCRVDVRQLPRVARRMDTDLGVRALVDGTRHRRNLPVVDIPRVLEEQFLHTRQADLRYWGRADLEKSRVQGPYQRSGADLPRDEDLIPLPRLDRVIDQNPRQLLTPLVYHLKSSFRKTFPESLPPIPKRSASITGYARVSPRVTAGNNPKC